MTSIPDDTFPALSPQGDPVAPLRNLEDLVFVAFNGRAFAVDRYDGTIAWRFKLPKGSGFVSILLDGDRLIVSSNGYTYALDPWRGTQLWYQEFSGEGFGIPSLASARGGPSQGASSAAQTASDEAAAAAQHSVRH